VRYARKEITIPIPTEKGKTGEGGVGVTCCRLEVGGKRGAMWRRNYQKWNPIRLKYKGKDERDYVHTSFAGGISEEGKIIP